MYTDVTKRIIEVLRIEWEIKQEKNEGNKQNNSYFKEIKIFFKDFQTLNFIF